uniref:Uncharacterized protein n=1 Tax=Bracon brevicornis TaxID=1563983 RepID=A0A6V7IHC8_9HYME
MARNIISHLLTLSILLLATITTLAASESFNKTTDVKNQHSPCTDQFRQRQKRLENFKFTFTDSKQLKLFKYLSARSGGRMVPSSAMNAASIDFTNFNEIMKKMIPAVYIDLHIFSLCYPKESQIRQIPKKNCETTKLRITSEYRERFQKLRDLYIDCWSSGELKYFLNQKETILPLAERNETLTICKKVFSSAKNYSEYSEEFPADHSKIVDECDYEQWKNLTQYELICKRSTLKIDPNNKADLIIDIEDRIGLLTSLPYDKYGPEDILTIRFGDTLTRNAEFTTFLGGIRKGRDATLLPLFGSQDIETQLAPHLFTKLTHNATEELMLRGLDLLHHLELEMMIVESLQSELSTYYKKVQYVFNAKSDNITLLEYAKVAGHNWGFKYVHIADGKAYEVSMSNDKIFGIFMKNSELPINSTVERVRRLLNKIVKFYWDVMETRGIYPQPPTNEDYAVTCKYEPLSKFIKFDHSPEALREDMITRQWMTGESPRFRNLTETMRPSSSLDNVTSDAIDTANQYSRLIRLSHDIFKDVDSRKFDIITLIGDLFVELSGLDVKPQLLLHPAFLYERGFVSKCKNKPQCEFLMILQLTGSALDLPYLNKSGEEVFIDNSGAFTYIPREVNEPKAIGRIRRILNTLAQYVVQTMN